MDNYISKIESICKAVESVVAGKDEVVQMAVTAIIAGGHILLEDIPGVGKTTLAVALSRVMQLDYKRMQFTPDVMPTDVVGYRVYSKTGEEIGFREGSVVCNLFLADEINRTSPKTQSALLEVMEEGNVTVDGITTKVPMPFTVIATQNPLGSAGTQPLPESQLDRFMVRLTIGYPDIKDEIALMRDRHEKDPMDELSPIICREELLELQQMAEHIFVHDAIYEYVARLADATRHHELIRLGMSPRGSLAVVSMAKANALLMGRDFVVPEDIEKVFAATVVHRMVLSPKARVGAVSLDKIASEILLKVSKPQLIKK